MESGTAFRAAERTFRRFKGRPAETLPQDAVIDPHAPDNRLCLVNDGVYEVAGGLSGLLVLPGALSSDEQAALATDIMRDYIWPPNNTSLDAFVDMAAAGNVFCALRDNTALPPASLKVRPGNAPPPVRHSDSNAPMSRAEAIALIRRMRWATLGMQYDWSAKVYPSLCPNAVASDPPFPPRLGAMCEALMTRILPSAAGWRAEAGIVNMYQVGDSLTGHVDRAEEDHTAPLLSVSLGAPCVFVVGGTDRSAEVSALVLRSGDAVVMSGAARMAYHGVPCILKSDGPLSASGAEESLASEILGTGRLNLNVRQVR